MKKIVSVALVLCVLSSSFCFAADSNVGEQSLEISMDNIEKVWMANSRDLAKYKSELFLYGSTFRDLVSNTDSMTNAPMGSISMDVYNSIFDNRDRAELSYKIAELQYKQNIPNAQLEAKKAFLTCWQNANNVDMTQKSLSLKQNQLKSEAVLLQQGYISQQQYNKTKSAVESTQDNLEVQRLQQETDQILLKSKLGLKSNTVIQLTYPKLGKESIEKLMQLDYKKDLEAYKKNNINLSILQLTYDSKKSQRPYVSGAEIETARVALEVAQDRMQKDFTVTYNNVLSQYKDLKTSYHQLQGELQSYNLIETQYKVGVAKSIDFANAGLAYALAEAQVKNKEISQYSTYLSYLNIVSGN